MTFATRCASRKPLQDTLIKDALGLTEFADEVMSLLPSAFAAGPGTGRMTTKY